jgi:hypothetical protein
MNLLPSIPLPTIYSVIPSRNLHSLSRPSVMSGNIADDPSLCLPPEVMVVIFSYLTPKELCISAQGMYLSFMNLFWKSNTIQCIQAEPIHLQKIRQSLREIMGTTYIISYMIL